MSFAVAQYRSTHVETASPVKLVVQLYDGALRFMRQAIQAIKTGDAPARGVALRKAHAIVGELQATLDVSQAPELCAELDRLYEFALYRITAAHFSADETELEPAISVLTELRGAWAELAKNER